MSSSLASAAGAASLAILASASIIALGAISRRWQLLSDSSTKDISKLQSTLLEPLLAFSSLSVLTRDDLAASLPFLLWPFLHVSLGLCLTFLLLPRSPRRGSLLVCAAFGNAGALPTALIPTLLSGSEVAQAMLFVQCYLATWRLLLWSVAPALLSNSRPKKSDDEPSAKAEDESLGGWLLRLLLPPPSVGSLLGLSLAFAPARARALLLTGPLAFLSAAAKSAGGASPPLVLVNLGYALSGVGGTRGGGGGSSSSSSAVSFTSYEVSVVVVIKLIALPALHLLMASVLHPTDPASGLSRDQDPFHLVLLLQAAMPAAVSVQAIFHREGADTKPLGPLMLLQYALAMPTIVVAIVLASRT